MSAIDSELIAKIGLDYDVTMLQISQHNNLTDRMYIYSKEVSDSIVAGGAHLYALEISHEEHQPLIDAYQKATDPKEKEAAKKELIDEMTRSYWGKKYLPLDIGNLAKRFTGFLDHAKEIKLEIYAADKYGPAASMSYLSDYLKRGDTYTPGELLNAFYHTEKDSTKSKMLRNCSSKAYDYIEEKFKDRLDTKFVYDQNFINMVAKDVIIERTEGDKELAQDLIKKSGGKKFAVAYGEGHGSFYDGKVKKDLDEYLVDGGRNVGKLLIVNDLKHINMRQGMSETAVAVIQTTDDPRFTNAYVLKGDYKLGGEVQRLPKSEEERPINPKELDIPEAVKQQLLRK